MTRAGPILSISLDVSARVEIRVSFGCLGSSLSPDWDYGRAGDDDDGEDDDDDDADKGGDDEDDS